MARAYVEGAWQPAACPVRGAGPRSGDFDIAESSVEDRRHRRPTFGCARHVLREASRDRRGTTMPFDEAAGIRPDFKGRPNYPTNSL